MALVLASSSKPTALDPTAELRAALRDFEAALLDDQKKLFKSNASKPDAESVTLFVANIAAANQGSHGRFLWKRLCPFLEATRQFTGIVNTFVSSNPPVAALFWGGVRTTILAASNAASYFDHVTSLLMEIGRLNPTFADFGQLYIGHHGLQSALCSYYTTVIRLCTKVVQDSQRTAFSHLYSTFFSPFQSEFKPMLDDLATAKDTIRDQISLAAKQAAAETNRIIEFESRENEKHRRFAAVFRSDLKKENDAMDQWRNKHLQRSNAKTRDKIRTNLSQINYMKAWRQALQPRVQGTAEWFEANDSFNEWRRQPSTAVMWCRGNMGVGKTVFVSNIVHYLIEHRTSNETVSFHFCRSDDAASLLARNIVGTLTRQIIENCIQSIGSDGLNSLRNESESSETVDMIDLILLYLDKNKMHYIVIDGLDECTNSDVSEIQRAFARLFDKYPGTLKILYSSRPDLEHALRHPKQCKYKMSLAPQNVRNDIDNYIDLTLDICLKDEKLELNDPTIVLKIAKTLKEGSQGMFLWARFFIGELCTCLSDSEILQALEQLPQELSKLLDAILLRIKTDRRSEHTMHTLEYCGVSRRPMTLDELQEALSVTQGQKSLDRHKMPTDMARVVSACRGLVFVDDIDETVHYVHHSLKIHLFCSGNSEPPQFNEAISDLLLGRICLTYLNFSDFQRQLTRIYAGATTPMDPVKMAVISTAPSNKLGSFVARKLLSSQSHLRKQNIQEVQKWAQDAVGRTASERLQQELNARDFHFLSYAGIYWLDHTKTLDPNTNLHVYRQLLRIYNSENSFVSKPWLQSGYENPTIITVVGESTNFNSAVMAWAVRNQHIALLKMQLSYLKLFTPDSGGNEMHEQVYESFDWCVNHTGYLEIGRLLLPFIPDAVVSERRLFWRAMEHGNDELADLLLSRCRSDLGPESNFTALRTAIALGLSKTVRTLFSDGSEIQKVDKEALLELAFRSPGNTAVISALLNQGGDVDVLIWHETPLTLATRKGNLEVMDLLISMGATVNTRNTQGNTPLGIACCNQSVEAVDLLLAAGASFSEDRKKELEGAYERGNWTVVRRLLEAGGDLSFEWFMHNRLTEICCRGDVEAAKKLVEAGANAVSPDRSHSCLVDALTHRQPQIVDWLLIAGVDINLKSRYGSYSMSAFEVAIWLGESAIARHLLALGATVDLESDGFVAAVLVGNVERVRRYIDAGIDFSDFKKSSAWKRLRRRPAKRFKAIRSLLEGHSSYFSSEERENEVGSDLLSHSSHDSTDEGDSVEIDGASP